uniref:F-box protein n=3 Tax=Noccaea caerulescens TaxID=107243 RepID=A0A1J3ESG6_NOCCA
MEINCDELLGGSYSDWGMKKAGDYKEVELGGFGEDDFLNRMSFSGYQIIYETVDWVASGDGASIWPQQKGNTLFNDFVGFGEISGNSVLNSLPEDPFCMNIRSTLNTISDWFHENQMDLVSESRDEPIGVDQTLFKSLDCFSNGTTTTMLQEQISSLKMNGVEGLGKVTLPEDPFCMKVRSTLNTISDWFHENQRGFVSKSHDEPIGVVEQQMGSSDLDDAGEPHVAFELVLPYLEMRDVLAVEGVCRSLRDSVRKEPFFWSTIDLNDSPLKYRVTNDSLLKLTHRAQGHLQCLNLGGCVGITDNGLMQVLASNPRLTKLSVSGCHRLSTAGMLSILRDLKSSNLLGIKYLITGGALYFTKEQFEELNSLLGADANAVPKSRKQRFYTSCRSELSLEDDRVTDLEICPWCEKPSLVFDCAAETCPLKDNPCSKSSCRACVVCIERCHDCGSCLNDCEYKPFCFAFSCVVCYKKTCNQLQELL